MQMLDETLKLLVHVDDTWSFSTIDNVWMRGLHARQ